MYYSHSCTYCAKIFYTFNENKQQASSVLYYGIKKHLIDYDEDHKEYEMDDGASIDINQIYAAVVESSDEPLGGYEI